MARRCLRCRRVATRAMFTTSPGEHHDDEEHDDDERDDPEHLHPPGCGGRRVPLAVPLGHDSRDFIRHSVYDWS